MIDYRYKGSVTNMRKVKEYYLEEEYTPIQAIEMLQKENQQLKNIIKDIKSQLDYLETYSSKEDVFEDMKRRLDRIDKIIGSE